MADNPVAPPAPQVAGGGGKPPGKRRQQERAGKRKRQKEKCRTCGESDHESEEHFKWTLMNAINALTGARQERLQAKRTASSASNNQVAPAAQEGGQKRKNKTGPTSASSRAKGGEGPQVLPQGTDEPPLSPPMEDTAMDVECCGDQELPALPDGDDSDL
ncbi:hypothetical protein BDV36DRAFT_292694 [Aspergillus pseudocaelatus]|uniref:Uncharacterized protein n=1 Tax=Aspergillus pseudocaelatus TaxID=1825620 RepID=A0ABQ6WV80_9EURO|nr:hypothetical protein BDV36DRAFT_292694 [Aspergillus pseudocaelatus]